jgi:hypothetical protein
MMSWFTAIIWKFCLKPTKTAKCVFEITQQQALSFANICQQRNLWKRPNNKWKVIVVDGLDLKLWKSVETFLHWELNIIKA